jgi:predicted nucleic acid-binding protein
MNGSNRVVLDTNAVISLLAGNRALAEQLEAAEYVGISIITYLEFLAFDGLSEGDRYCFARFCERVEVVALSLDDEELLSEALALRTHHGLKLPDAIIGATALTRNALLITNDTHFAALPHEAVHGC